MLLFLKSQPDTGSHDLVNPQGRFSVVDGRLFAVAVDDPVARRLDLKSLPAAIALIRSGR